MAVKKNIDTKKNIINKNGISEPYEKEVFFKVNPDIDQAENIKLAQALNQETINNIQSDASPDLIPPDELQLNDSGQPNEELTTSIESAIQELNNQHNTDNKDDSLQDNNEIQTDVVESDIVLINNATSIKETTKDKVEEKEDNSFFKKIFGYFY